jgi:hypothetical protein
MVLGLGMRLGESTEVMFNSPAKLECHMQNISPLPFIFSRVFTRQPFLYIVHLQYFGMTILQYLKNFPHETENFKIFLVINN